MQRSFLKNLGCDVEVDATVQGARGAHNIDVWVAFRRCGMNIRWGVECKLWKRRVSKEKVMALISIVEDVGADRGVNAVGSWFSNWRAFRRARNKYHIGKLGRTRSQRECEIARLGDSQIGNQSYTNKGIAARSTSRGRSGRRCGLRIRGRCRRDSGAERDWEARDTQFWLSRMKTGTPPFPALLFDESGDRPVLANTKDQFIGFANDVVTRALPVLEAQPRPR
jgi:restriction endonuclease